MSPEILKHFHCPKMEKVRLTSSIATFFLRLFRTSLIQLPEKSKSTNPLAVKEMTDYKHQSDKETYRGLGTRTDKKERGKLIELFLLYSEKQESKITHPLIDLAVTNYLSYVLLEERRKKSAKVK